MYHANLKPARHLRYADSVIVLDKDGKIAQQTTPEALADANLDLESPDPERAHVEPELEIELPEEIQDHLAIAEEEDADADRRVGDLKIYAYFIGVAGWSYMVLYVILYSAFVFGLRFPGMSIAIFTNMPRLTLF